MARVQTRKLLHKPATHSGGEDVKTPGLVKRGDRWQFRRRIPDQLRQYFDNKREFLKSLGDVSLKEAKRLAAREWANTDDLLAEAERKHANRTLLDDLSKGEIAALARTYFADQEKAAKLLSDDFNDQALDDRIEVNEEDLIALGHGPAESAVQHVALAIAKDAGVEASFTDKNFFALAEAVHAAMLEHHKRLDDRLNQRPIGIYDQRFSEENMRKARGPSLDQMVDRWAKKEVPPAAKSVEKARKVMAEFTTAVAKVPVTGVTPDHVQQFKQHLLDTNETTATAESKLNIFRAVIRYGRRNRVIETDPCMGISIQVKARGKDRRRAYTTEELSTIFGSGIYTEGHRPLGGNGVAAYWLPLLALYTGARLEELGQLRLKDIRKESYWDNAGKEQHAWTIRIVEDEADGLHVKNKGSERRIPIHSDLIQLGFLKFVESAEKKRQYFLFPQFEPNKYGVRTANWSKWYGRLLRKKLGITDRAVTFHSFRHTFKDQARNTNMPVDVNNEITGHETGDTGNKYGGLEYPVKPLVEGMRLYRIIGFKLPPPPPELANGD